LERTLQSFNKTALKDMAEFGVINANCEFCDTTYSFPLTEI